MTYVACNIYHRMNIPTHVVYYRPVACYMSYRLKEIDVRNIWLHDICMHDVSMHGTCMHEIYIMQHVSGCTPTFNDNYVGQYEDNLIPAPSPAIPS